MAYQQINIGVPGDPSTGDDIHTGGEKLNSMLAEVFQANAPDSGDYRMTGWWLLDTSSLIDTGSDLPAGVKIDMDNRVASKTVTVGDSTTYSVGDEIMLRDRYESWDTNPLGITAGNGGTVNGKGTLVVRSPGAVVTLTCRDPSINQWDARVISQRGRFDNLINTNLSVTADASKSAVLYDSANVFSMKIMVTAVVDGEPNRRTVSELLITDDGTQVFATEYAVLNTDESPVVDISFDYTAGQASIVLETSEPSVTASVKSIEVTEV